MSFPHRWFYNARINVGRLLLVAALVTALFTVHGMPSQASEPVPYLPVALQWHLRRTVDPDAVTQPTACAAVQHAPPLCISVYASEECALERCHGCNVTEPVVISAWQYEWHGERVCVPPQSALPHRVTAARQAQIIWLAAAGVGFIAGVCVLAQGVYLQLTKFDVQRHEHSTSAQRSPVRQISARVRRRMHLTHADQPPTVLDMDPDIWTAPDGEDVYTVRYAAGNA